MKGYIYVWKHEGIVKYVGRTITTVSNRTQGHIRDYNKQLISGLKTKKFIEINKLPNEWNDICVETIEVVEDIRILGFREKYWYSFYMNNNDLWNSVIPDTSEYLGLNMEEKIARKKDLQFKKFLDSFLKQKMYDFRHILNNNIYNWNLKEITPNQFNIIKNPNILDLNTILITELNKIKNMPWLSYLIVLMNENKELFENDIIEYEDNIIQVDFENVFNEFQKTEKTYSFAEIMNYFIDNNVWKYRSKDDKLDYYIERNKLFLEFEYRYKTEYVYLNFTKNVKKLFRTKIIQLNRQEVLLKHLEKHYKDFVNNHPDDVYGKGTYNISKNHLIFGLNTYIRGKNISGGQDYNISTHTFEEIDESVREYVFDKYYYKKGLPNPFNEEEVKRYRESKIYTYKRF